MIDIDKLVKDLKTCSGFGCGGCSHNNKSEAHDYACINALVMEAYQAVSEMKAEVEKLRKQIVGTGSEKGD